MECERCPERERGVVQEDGRCGMCRMRPLLKFTPEFRGWVDQMLRLWHWRRAGYQITEEIGYEGWAAQVEIEQWFEQAKAKAAAEAMKQ